MSESDGAPLVSIRIVGLALDDLRHSAEHHDELFREFALIRSRDPEPGHSVPGRLLDLIDELTSQFSGFSAVPQAEIDAAQARGDAAIDVEYHMPAGIGPACERFVQLLEEADAYCRHGDLLTLAPPPDAVAFREWFLLEFVNQAAGRAPTPWPEFVSSRR